MSLRYQVFHSIRAGYMSCPKLAEHLGITRKKANDIVSKLRRDGYIDGRAGFYATTVSEIINTDGRGRHGKQAIVAERSRKVLMNGDGRCLLAECWPEPLKQEVSDGRG